MASTSTTGTAVWAGITADDSAKPDTTVQLAAINAAIRASHRHIMITQYAPSFGTITAQTFDYSLSSLSPAPYRKLGVRRVFIQAETSTSAPPEVHDVMQYFDASTDAWNLRFAPSVVSAYATKTYDLEYLSPHLDVTALSDTIYLPFEYLQAYIDWWLARNTWSQNLDSDWAAITRDAKEYLDETIAGFKTLDTKSLKLVPQRLV